MNTDLKHRVVDLKRSLWESEFRKLKAMNINEIVKAPKYFKVHFDESYVGIDGYDSGRAYPITCDGFTCNVYGLSEEEAVTFDPHRLRGLLRGSRLIDILWDAPDRETLMKEIENDERVKSGVYKLARWTLNGQIEDIPACSRMYIDKSDPALSILCGKPKNEFNDGCLGGCIIQGYDIEDETLEEIKCPLKKMWEERSKKAKVSA